VAVGSLGPHDIGKTIIHSMLIAASLDVIDMGIMLTPEKVEKTLKENPAVKAIGLSVLLTSDIGKAGVIVRRAKAANPGIKVMVGGSAMSPKVMKDIGADGFGKNANEAVKLAKGFIGAARSP
jgi:5-methyltetrahydrofolate--homocysteine methyltransferase